MEKKFVSGDMPLGQLLDQAHNGVLQLPDFQRGWVWDDNHISSLLASVSLSFPIGAVMTLRTGNPDVKFKPRLLEGVVLPADVSPEFLLLDGQQRATSLYQALRSGKPVNTRDSRRNGMTRRYFAHIPTCIDPHADREDAIVSVPAGGLVTTFRGEVALDVTTREKQIEAQMFPLDIIFDRHETGRWQMQYIRGDMAGRFQVWMDFNTAVVVPFTEYTVPTIELTKVTPKEAVCQVFEKVNTGGVSLTVFELLTATFAADDVNLRDDWAKRRAEFEAYELLADFEATGFLQILTLLATRDRRERHLADGGGEPAPAVSCKRRDVLRLELGDYQRLADTVSAAMPRVVRFLHGERIFTSRDLPYSTQVVPLAAIMAALGERADGHGLTQMLRQWYWCGVFGEMYGGSTETRFANDLQDVIAWVDGGDEPRTVRESQFQAQRLLTLRTRNSAAYKGLFAQQIRRGGRDFRTGATIDLHAYVDDAIDVHHIFPKRWCAENAIPDGIVNCVVNKTTIDARTNRRVGGSAPSRYLERIETSEQIEADNLDAILRSHDIDPIALRRDDFPAFFTARFERLVKQIEDATGKLVNRAADGSDNPYAARQRSPEHVVDGIRRVIAARESKVVEFKSTARWNVRAAEKDAEMEVVILKTIAGFMNTHGGTLLVGVDDDGNVVGIGQDFPTLGKKNLDGWELWFTDLLERALGRAAATDVTVTFGDLDELTVARIDVGPGSRPVFTTAKGTKSDLKQAFFVRVNNSTRQFVGAEAHDYQRKRWPA